MKWLEVAQNLPLGQKTDIECPEQCGSGKKLSVHHTAKDYWCNCYRCGYTDRQKKGKLSLKELEHIRKLNEQATTIELPLELPNDFTTDIPREGRVWLFKAGITESVRKQYNIGYSKLLERVVLPVYNTSGELIWYQCRAVHRGQEPKYIQPRRGRDEVLFQVKGGRTSLQRAIIVEDILSAIRVGRFENCYSLLGTKISTTQAAELSKYNEVVTWLDPDKAGQNGAYKIRKTLGLVTDVRNVVTSKDPKELSDKQIKETLCL